jgi:hypothetical protein
LTKAVERLAADGSIRTRGFGAGIVGKSVVGSAAPSEAKRLVYLKLMEKIRIPTCSNSFFDLGEDRGANAANVERAVSGG